MDTINKVYISFMMKSIFLFENWRTLTIFYFIFEPNIHCVVYPFFSLDSASFFSKALIKTSLQNAFDVCR